MGYLTMVKFVNFKLFHDLGLHYPPKIDDLANAKRAGLTMLQLKAIKEEGAEGTSEATPEVQTKKDSKERLSQSLQQDIAHVIQNLDKEKEEPDEPMEEKEEANDANQDDDDDDLADMQEKPQPPVFAGFTFLLGREVPVDSLEFILLCGGAKVLKEDLATEAQMRDSSITHQICDRPQLKHCILSREYVQPQWVYDSLNADALLPCEPYKPGVAPPPHLSPFVDDVEVGYIPEQRKVLEGWGAKGGAITAEDAPENEEEDANEGDEDSSEDDEEDAESTYAKELEMESSGVAFSEQQDKDEDGDEGDEGGEGDAEEEEEEEEEARPAKKSKQDPKELAKIMMTKKEARLYSKMQYGINKKREANEVLEQRKQKIQKEKKQQTPGKEGASKTPPKKKAKKAA